MGVKPEKLASKEADTINHKLLVQAGFVRQLMAGVYTYLPLGLRVLRKIENIVREEMDAIGGEEILMPMLHPAEIWKKTGGWDSIDVLFKLKSRTDRDYALGQSQEEVVTPTMKEFIKSYRDLPRMPYHIQWKFRDELRSKSGILRGREFLMKDMYSFHLDQADFDRFYEVAKQAYLKIYARMGLQAKVTEASGGAFSEKISYEFEVLTDAGEANILYCDSCEFCVNIDDITSYKEGDKCPKCGNSKLKPSIASEVGNVFDLGDKYSKAFDLKVATSTGEQIYPIMGCYGIGVSRTMGVIVEKFHDDKGILWPAEVAPYTVHLIDIKQQEKAQEIYNLLDSKNIEVLWDDREINVGGKFSDADLIGCPWRVIVSDKSLTTNEIEVKARQSDEPEMMSLEQFISRLKGD
ncbi:MAG: Prolyl-tRNA synthetase [Candidatus Collierbacteria bacterium GW2011_GWB1_44_6]|uniref:Proline--tRNA ligase n=2 Tax=Candidatus Collieribacteriota TaxID=1752725 RepID=A0A0G1LX46_9BACT|nr:MAG: Prolyl-tRNA synthetase [Candidatus Collierbacteria bacterium GW2011_GWC2_43_12]KKT73397.1 MAG: Prolyl-tRNA synthetase [Candidatus Collierbacteria bacterium GW2011_GWB1_44_6]KKT82909.1 MAG: prolyl-tRNA synthetase, prolyl-tRNA synthetase [Microgenomates group bacterium GW2011_GWC1_44_9]